MRFVFCVWWTAVVLVFGDGCAAASEQCEGNNRVLRRGDRVRILEECHGACIAAAQPFCALAAEPDARCGTASATCDGATRLVCRDGYLVARLQCAVACDEADGARCTLAPTPDSRCTYGLGASACDGDTWLSCDSGFVVARVACPDGMVCRTVENSFCALDGERDPRCPRYARRFDFCAGNELFRCRYGYLVLAATCASCRADEFDDAWCVGDGTASVGLDDGIPL